MAIAGAKRTKSASSADKATHRPVKRPDTRETLNMRIRPEVRTLIDQAAELTGKNRTDFVLDAALQAARNAVLDRTMISLQEKSYADFVALLNAPPQPNEGLRKTMQTPPSWG